MSGFKVVQAATNFSQTQDNVTEYLITHTNTCIYIYIYILFKKSKIYIKTFKTLLHVSITRSSSGMLPEDDRVIETCTSILNVLM